LSAGTILSESQCGSAFAAQPDSSGGAVVKLVRATKECFSDTIYVTGILVPRQQAVVILDGDSRVAEVLASEGDQVNVGQVLARATRQSSEGPSAAGAPASAKPTSNTITLTAPAAGLVTQSTASVGAGPSPRGEPLFRIMIDNEIELEADVSRSASING
jgi:hypothetical protein